MGRRKTRKIEGRLGADGAHSSAVLLACLGVALTLAVGASSAVGAASSFSPPAVYSTGRDTVPISIAIGDLNSDNRPDLATADWVSSNVSVLLNKGAGRFQARRHYRTGDLPISIGTGDLNGDGALDLVTANHHTVTISVLLNRGDGSFEPKHDYRTGLRPLAVAVGDLTGDGKPEVATANAYLADPRNRNPGTVSVFVNNGNGTFQDKRDYRPGKFPRSVAIRDLNGDGRLDLATANVDANTVSVFINPGDGSLGPRRDFRTGTAPRSLAIGDLNGDRSADLVTASPRTDTISVLLNKGEGQFRSPHSYRAADYVEDIVIGDLNGDRTPDLAVAGCSVAISVLDNRGDGSFERFVDHRTSCAWSVAIGDLNGDGRNDLATANGSDRFDRGLVSVFINRPGRCTVQPVIGLVRAAAIRAILHANCKVGRVRLRYSQHGVKGHVIAQRPSFGAVLPKGGKVELVVSRGRKQ
jgi:FG-GAP-like repeat/PASTA domain